MIRNIFSIITFCNTKTGLLPLSQRQRTLLLGPLLCYVIHYGVRRSLAHISHIFSDVTVHRFTCFREARGLPDRIGGPFSQQYQVCSLTRHDHTIEIYSPHLFNNWGYAKPLPTCTFLTSSNNQVSPKVLRSIFYLHSMEGLFMFLCFVIERHSIPQMATGRTTVL